MEQVGYGRKTFKFSDGEKELTSTSITEKPELGEDETSFTNRLVKKYKARSGTVEVVIKAGRPQYAIITFS